MVSPIVLSSLSPRTKTAGVVSETFPVSDVNGVKIIYHDEAEAMEDDDRVVWCHRVDVAEVLVFTGGG
jgi:hypothetical protein